MIGTKDFFNHNDLPQIINFLLYGKEGENKSKDTYEHRIRNISTDILGKMKYLNLEDNVYEKKWCGNPCQKFSEPVENE